MATAVSMSMETEWADIEVEEEIEVHSDAETEELEAESEAFNNNSSESEEENVRMIESPGTRENRRETMGYRLISDQDTGPINVSIAASIAVAPPITTAKATMVEPVQQAKRGEKASKSSKSRQLVQEERAGSSQKGDVMAEGVTKIKQTEKGRSGGY